MNNNFELIINRYKYLIISLISVAVYAQTIGFDLTYCDDHDIILTYYERISSFANLTNEFFKGYIGTAYYRPIINISFLIDSAIAGQNLWIYHFSNIIYHTIFSILLFRLFVKLKYNSILSLLATIIFVVNPLNVNAVAWIVGRNDSIMGIFSILSFIAIIEYFKNSKIEQLILFSIATLLSILSKESGLFFIPVIVFYFFKVKSIKISNQNFIYMISSIAFAIFLWLIFRTNAELGENINKMGLDVFISNLRVIPEYVGKFILPFHTSVLATFSQFNTILGLVVIILMGGGVYYASKRRELNYTRIIFGILWFLLPIFPTLLISIININDWNEYVECRAYLPSVGILIILMEILPKEINFINKKILIPIILLILLFASFTILESRNYKDSITFYETAVKDNPSKPLFHFVLSRRYREANLIEKEEQSIRAAMELRPKYAKYPYNFGIFFFNNKKNDSAIKYLNLAMKLDPKYREIYKSLGALYFKTEDYKSAYQIWELAKKNIENTDEFELNIASALFMMNEYPKLDSIIQKFSKENKFQKELYSFFITAGENAYQKKDYNRAITAYDYCISINPNFLDPYLKLFEYFVEIEKNKERSNYFYEIIKQSGIKLPQQLIDKYERL